MRHLFLLLFTACCFLYPRPAGAQHVLPAPSVRLRQISIAGNTLTRRAVILRELSVQEGQWLPKDSLESLIAQTRLRLANLALFTTIKIDAVTTDSVTDWQITVKERWYIIPKPSLQLADRNFNVWWKEQDRDLRRINIGLTLTHNNFRGNLERLSIAAQAGYTQRLGIDYQRPYLDRRQRHGAGFSFNASRSGELAYTTDSNKLRFVRLPGNHIIRQYDAALLYTYRPAYATRHLLQLSYHDIRIEDTVVHLNRDYFEGGSDRLRYIELLYRIDQNYVDNWNYPLTGFKTVSYLILRSGLEGMRAQAQLRTEAGWFHRVAPKWYTALIFRGRLSLPGDQPYYFRPALGTKTEYVRGYEYYVADGSHYGLLRADLKRELLNTTLLQLPFRYLPSLPVRIYAKLFADAGYARNGDAGNSFLNDRLLYGYGFGLDIVTAYDLKIRLEFAWNHLGQNGLFLHLNSE